MKIKNINESFTKLFENILIEDVENEDDEFYDTFFDPFFEKLVDAGYLEVDENSNHVMVYDELDLEGEINLGPNWNVPMGEDEPRTEPVYWTVYDWPYIIDTVGEVDFFEDYFCEKLDLKNFRKLYKGHYKGNLTDEAVSILYTKETRERLLKEFNPKDAASYIYDYFLDDAIEDAEENSEPDWDDDGIDWDAINDERWLNEH